MASKAWTKHDEYNGCEVWEVELDSTDTDSLLLKIDHTKSLTIAASTTGSAVLDVVLQFENPNNSNPKQFTFASSVGTVSGVDWVKGSVGPITGIGIQGTIAGADTAVVQVIQSTRRT